MQVFDRMRESFLNSDEIDDLCLVYSNFCINKLMFKVHKRSLLNFKY